jgi:hypothetical protein
MTAGGIATALQDEDHGTKAGHKTTNMMIGMCNEVWQLAR